MTMSSRARGLRAWLLVAAAACLAQSLCTAAEFVYDVPLHPASPWPQVRRDRANTGRAAAAAAPGPAAAPGSDAVWSFRTLKGIFNTAVVGPAQEVLVGSADKASALPPARARAACKRVRSRSTAWRPTERSGGRCPRWRCWTRRLRCSPTTLWWCVRLATSGGLASCRASALGRCAQVPCADGRLRRVDIRTGRVVWEFHAHHSERDADAHEGRMCGGVLAKLPLLGTRAAAASRAPALTGAVPRRAGRHVELVRGPRGGGPGRQAVRGQRRLPTVRGPRQRHRGQRARARWARRPSCWPGFLAVVARTRCRALRRRGRSSRARSPSVQCGALRT